VINIGQYAEKVQPPYDFHAVYEGIVAKVTADAYSSEYEFGFELYRSFQNLHDGHFVFYPDSVTGVFTFGRSIPLVSVSMDGQSLPEPYAFADVLTASFGNSSFTPSAIVAIEGQNATDYLLDWSQYGSLQDRDALYNNLFYIPAQISLGSSGSGTGTFSGGGRGRVIYPGPTTTLTFANGTTSVYDNFARVLVDFENITTGADIYEQYFAVPQEAFDNALALATSTTATTSTTSSSAAPTSTTTTSTPAPGYPTPVVRHSNNYNGGYFLDGEDYDDVAVLNAASFVGGGGSQTEFQNVNSEFIAAALAANKTKLIIDVSANGGGTILQGYDLFKQLFPSILPYGATRFRAHEAFDLIGQEFSELAGQWPRSLTYDDGNETIQGILASAWNYRHDVDVNYELFSSWAEKYGPHAYGPGPDNFTSIIRWNLSDVLIPNNSGGIYVSGYLNRSNVTTQPFHRDNIIIITDGYCASTCTIFSEFMRQQAGVQTILLGGRPNYDIAQAIGGVKGTNSFPYSYILSGVETVFAFEDESGRDYYNDTALGDYTQYPFYRSPSVPVVNSRDGLREGDETQLPLQFLYEPADCRVFYTPEMVVDETAVWKTIADTVWGDVDACIAGNDGFYGGGSGNGTTMRRRRRRDTGRKVRREQDAQVFWDSFGVSSGFSSGLGLMPI